ADPIGGPGRCPDPPAYFYRDESVMSIRLSSLCFTVGFSGLVAFAGLAGAEEVEYWECRTPHKIFGNKAEIDSREDPPLTPYERHARAGHPQCISPIADWS